MEYPDQTVHSTVERDARREARRHAAHLHQDAESIAPQVALFANQALAAGEAVILIATQPHLHGALARLEAAGQRCSDLQQSGQLHCIDAEWSLGMMMRRNEPDLARMRTSVVPLVERALAAFGRLSIYGELVSILWRQGNFRAITLVEQEWNRLIDCYGFALLCGYCVDVFDMEDHVHDGLASMCRTHTELTPIVDEPRFERAVEAALRSVMQGRDDAAQRSGMLHRSPCGVRMPAAQAALMNLDDLMPAQAREVRLAARDFYNRLRW